MSFVVFFNVVIPSHEYEMLGWIAINYLFYTDLFSISAFNIGFIKDWASLFFYLFFMRMARPHYLSHEFVMLTQIDLELFLVLFFIFLSCFLTFSYLEIQLHNLFIYLLAIIIFKSLLSLFFFKFNTFTVIVFFII